MATPQHFLTLLDFSPTELVAIIERAIEMKREHRAGVDQRRFAGKVLGMILGPLGLVGSDTFEFLNLQHRGSRI